MAEEIRVKDLKFDHRNYRKHGKRNKQLIKKSVAECGLGRSVVVDAENCLVAGNGLVSSLDKKTKVKVVETDGTELVVVKRTDLKTNDERRRNLAVMDNSASDSSEFDLKMIAEDFSIPELNEMGVDLPEIKVEPEEEYLVEEPNILEYNENVFFPSKNKFDIPELRSDRLYSGPIDDVCFGPRDNLEKGKTYLCLYGQHKLDNTAKGNVIGFFVDDRRFEVVWNNAVLVLNKFKEIRPKALMAPNFSLWADEPLPYQIMSWYKTQWCARYWQEAGFDIIPTLNWSSKKSFEFCFLGLPQSIPLVAIQCRNIRTEKEKRRFLEGLLKAKEVLNFKKCVCYGEGINKFKEFLVGLDYCTIRSWNDKKKEAGR